jgi:AbrB family looped-hinge helix DNA binding protein
MATDDPADTTTISDRYAVTVPAEIRQRLDIEPGDKLRWHITEDDELTVEVLEQRYGAFDDYEPADMGETDAVAEHDLMGLDAEHERTETSDEPDHERGYDD